MSLENSSISKIFTKLMDFVPLCVKQLSFVSVRDESRFFSRGGGIFSKILSIYFYVDQIDFSSSPKALKRPCFGQSFCAAYKILKKQAKKEFLSTFWTILTKKLHFLRVLPPQN